jgi:exodeoxyribonuclease VII small subunit
MDSDDRIAIDFEEWDGIAGNGEFEETLGSLREVVAILEGGNLRLADAVHCYEVGTKLARRCEFLLDTAELRITRLDDDGGTIGA